ncbi:triacylglycerol lipase 1 isoform X2 [Hevea brasiliensis]|uniref:triacylglycerol lipase 1 isoform X2 n=1 Tax=Hevea brasiliensis TaxID=3981 RepID=UPI000B7889F4|nr:triacylglycerol lipase 1 isoform X2 [Hevea brasiliensis]
MEMIMLIILSLLIPAICGEFIARGANLRHQSPGETLCSQLIEPAGYPCTEHTIQTKDGYLLALQRVSSRNGNIRLQRGPPVLLQHGLFMAGDAWFLDSPEQSLGYILADEGFDIWVGNVRGTFWSYGHVSLSDKDKEFWDWSWQELALFDLSEMIQHIYSTANSKVFVVGHSQGTLMSLAALTQPNIVEMVEAAALLCPISYLEHISAPFVLRMVGLHLDQMVLAMGIHQLNFRSKVLINLLDSMCDGLIECDDLLTSITVIRQGTFSQYDYGILKNLKLYGQVKPPAFDLSLIPKSLPLWMGYGGYDALADVTDVEHTLKELQSKPELLYLENYGHLDFLISVQGKKDVFKHMIRFFRSLGKSSS